MVDWINLYGPFKFEGLKDVKTTFQNHDELSQW